MLARMRAARCPSARSEQGESRTERPAREAVAGAAVRCSARFQAVTHSGGHRVAARRAAHVGAVARAFGMPLTEFGLDVTVSGRRSGAGEAATSRALRSRRALKRCSR